MLRLTMAPTTARQARLLRIANKLAAAGVPGAPTTESDKLLWARSHAQRARDMRASEEEEQLRAPLIPKQFSANNLTAGTTHSQSLFHFRDYPMYPGEYVPPEHNTLSSVRDDLRLDLTAQSIKDAWLRVSSSGGYNNMNLYETPGQFYERTEGLDPTQVTEIVSALFPSLQPVEAEALVKRILEAISRPESTPARHINSTVSAEALGLDSSPGHYTNFMEWMGRMMETKSFKTEHALYQFCRRRFNRHDVRLMWENYKLFSKDSLKLAQSDGYSHFYSILKDYSAKTFSEDSRGIKGVRIDPREMDFVTGLSFGEGQFHKTEVVAWIRENRDGTGKMNADGKPINVVCDDAAWNMEQLLWPFDEAGLNVNEFDVYLQTRKNYYAPRTGDDKWVAAARLAVAQAISKLLPTTRVPLKKAGLLSIDRRLALEYHPGYLDGKTIHRPFYKR